MVQSPSRSFFTPLVESLPASVPFVGPETQERARGRPFAARLGANEHGFGPSPKVVQALGEAAADAWMYGDPEGYELRKALAEHVGADLPNIALGEGIDGLLGLACRLTLTPDDAAVTSNGAYPTFNYHVIGHGGRLVKAPYRHDRSDVVALAGLARRSHARLLYIANPDNPMGGLCTAEEIQEMIDSTPEDCLILLDEAYMETIRPDAASDSSPPPLDLERPNLLRLRTFSKAYGLAGLRVGYAIGAAETIAAFDKVRNHFGVGRLAQAGALAALRDQDGLKSAVAMIAASRERLAAIAEQNGLLPLDSHANFVTIDCRRGPVFVQALMKKLADLGVFTRAPGVAPLNRCIRISCGPEPEMAVFAEALPKALAELS